MSTPKRTQRKRPARWGVSILEAITSLAMLGVVLGIASRALVQVDHLAAARARSELATCYLENQMERVQALRQQDRTPQRIVGLALPEEAHKSLPKAEFTAEAAEAEALPDALRVTLTITWDSGGASQPRRKTLTAYFPAEPSAERPNSQSDPQ